MSQHKTKESGMVKKTNPVNDTQQVELEREHKGDPSGLTSLQQSVGNQAVSKLLAQRKGEGPNEVDDDTAERINQVRGGGRALDEDLQVDMGQALGHDLSQVRVHDSADSDDLNKQLNARAFTTGQDVFFRQGEYNPQSFSGQELIAHELAHVVQQTSGRVNPGGGKLTVNEPGDRFEQEADNVANQITSTTNLNAVPTAGGEVQKQEDTEEEYMQMQEDTEEEEEYVQMQDIPEEEEVLQTQEVPEEEEEALQMQDIPEDEETLQMQEAGSDSSMIQRHQISEDEQAPGAEQAPTSSTAEAPITEQAPTSATTETPSEEQVPTSSTTETATEELTPTSSSVQAPAQQAQPNQPLDEQFDQMLSRQPEGSEEEEMLEP